MAIAIKWAVMRYSTVASFCSCRWFVVNNPFVVGIDDPAHVIHTAVAYFYIVPVEYFMENMLFREMFVD